MAYFFNFHINTKYFFIYIPRIILHLYYKNHLKGINYFLHFIFQNVEVFSSIGGFIGMWLGMSLLDIADIVEGFFRISRFSFKRKQELKENRSIWLNECTFYTIISCFFIIWKTALCQLDAYKNYIKKSLNYVLIWPHGHLSPRFPSLFCI